MFDRLEDLLRTYEELMEELNDPALAQDQTRYRRLMKEQAELQPIVEAYKKYKGMNRDLSDASEMLETEKDEEMRKLLKDEIWQLKNDLPEVEEQLKILLLPRDPNDEQNVVLEIRSGAGGEEAALFAQIEAKVAAEAQRLSTLNSTEFAQEAREAEADAMASLDVIEPYGGANV